MHVKGGCSVDLLADGWYNRFMVTKSEFFKRFVWELGALACGALIAFLLVLLHDAVRH